MRDRLLAFRVVPLAGPPARWVSGTISSGLVVLSVAEALTVIGLGVQVALYAKPST
ncbi:hypothetical protein [Streptomyces europaeiscabiei]|uniref:hypothetical protein n=1 Tax=Streptomyces europaeiscabiei TaxID=146819 RepID=UPI002E2D8011|nr:hypothetical protein [Streptomyces europaeiscabiei]